MRLSKCAEALTKEGLELRQRKSGYQIFIPAAGIVADGKNYEMTARDVIAWTQEFLKVK